MLSECRHVFANARNTANRLAKFNGVCAQALYHPPPLAERLHAGRYGDYVLVVGRLETVKRPELAILAMAHVPPPTRLILVGDGLASRTGSADRGRCGRGRPREFAGSASGDELVELYAGALAVIYAPFDEDYGYVTLEAFLVGEAGHHGA